MIFFWNPHAMPMAHGPVADADDVLRLVGILFASATELT